MRTLLTACFSLLWALSAQAGTLHIAIISLAGEIEQPTTFAGIVVEERRGIERAARVALDEASLKLGLYDLQPSVTTIDLNPLELLAPQLEGLNKNSLVLLDLPAETLKPVAELVDQAGAVAVNTSSPDQRLRSELCLKGIYHTIPSDRMYFDALAQYLVHSGWLKVLLVHGTTEEDLRRKTLLAESLKRFGASLSDERSFTLSHHPDDRDYNKPEFLTGRSSYDVVAVVDSERDYGRRLEYSTRRPRPVVGDVGLVPRAWHFALERYGAPQLNERYRQYPPAMHSPKAAMTDSEFAAWAAVKFVVNSLDSKHIDQGWIKLRALFEDPDSRVDLYKGTRGSFRSWNHQLRHPILLTSDSYVLDVAPMPKFLHPRHYVDTLGEDQPEAGCQQ